MLGWATISYKEVRFCLYKRRLFMLGSGPQSYCGVTLTNWSIELRYDFLAQIFV